MIIKRPWIQKRHYSLLHYYDHSSGPCKSSPVVLIGCSSNSDMFVQTHCENLEHTLHSPPDRNIATVVCWHHVGYIMHHVSCFVLSTAFFLQWLSESLSILLVNPVFLSFMFAGLLEALMVSECDGFEGLFAPSGPLSLLFSQHSNMVSEMDVCFVNGSQATLPLSVAVR